MRPPRLAGPTSTRSSSRRASRATKGRRPRRPIPTARTDEHRLRLTRSSRRAAQPRTRSAVTICRLMLPSRRHPTHHRHRRPLRLRRLLLRPHHPSLCHRLPCHRLPCHHLPCHRMLLPRHRLLHPRPCQGKALLTPRVQYPLCSQRLPPPLPPSLPLFRPPFSQQFPPSFPPLHRVRSPSNHPRLNLCPPSPRGRRLSHRACS